MQTTTTCARCNTVVQCTIFCGTCAAPLSAARVPTEKGEQLLLLAAQITKGTAEPRTDAQYKKKDAALAKFTLFCGELGRDPFDTDPATAVAYLAIESRGTTVKTKTHSNKCYNYRNIKPVQDHRPCDCVCSLRAGSLLGTRYSIQAALRDRGLEERFNHGTGKGNPFMSAEVDRFCKSLASNQADATVSRPEPERLSAEQTKDVMTIALDAHDRWLREDNLLLAFRELRDTLAVALGWCLLDRGADVVRLCFSQIEINEDDTTPTMVVGKSLSKTARKETDLQPAVTITSSGGRFCVVKLMQAYIVLAARLDVNVKSGALLRGVRIQKRGQQPPSILKTRVTTADLRTRLGNLCRSAGVPVSGLHALRRGKARHLLLTGVPLEKIATAGAWKSTVMPAHYAGAISGMRRKQKLRA
jgi:hypothetical protein